MPKNGFFASVVSRGGARAAHRLTITPVRCTWAAVGGPDAAELAVSGAAGDLDGVFDLLGCKVTVFAPDGSPVWWGLAHEAASVEDGAERAVSLEKMANRIAVAYSIEGEGGSVSAQTPWLEDSRSIELYGRKELLYSLGGAAPEQAQAAAAGLLQRLALPRVTVQAVGGRGASATLRCIGFWRTLGWRYLTQSAGRIAHTGENQTAALLGWGFESSQLVGFDSRTARIHQLGAALAGLHAGDRIRVTGSASNDGSYTVVEAAAAEKQVVYAASAVSFDPSDDMHDGGGRLDQLRAGEMALLAGSVSNGGFWFLKSVSADHATLHPPQIVQESARPVTVTQGNSVRVAQPLTLERPAVGAKYITVLAHGVRLAQSFTVPSGDAPWNPGEVVLSVRRVGAPADALKVELCADAGGAPGAALDSGVLAAAALPAKSAAPVSVALSRTAQVTANGVYWLVVSRTGSVSPTDYYEAALDADASYAGGVLRLWTGAAWEARTPAAGLNFQVWGVRETTAQAADAVSFAAAYLTSAGVRSPSGVFTRQYRAGRSSALAEVEKLLAAGSADGRRLLATVAPDGAVVIDAAPDGALADLRWKGGEIVSRFGRPLPLAAPPVGQWVRFDGGRASALGAAGPAFVEAAELDAASGRVTPDFAQDESAWDIGGVRQG